MGKHKKWTLEQKVKIVKEFKNGATISYLNNKYGISGMGTVSRWNQEYDEGRLGIDSCGKKKYQVELEDIDILKKSYALLMEIPLSATQIEKYQIIDRLKSAYPILRICNVLNVNRRSYYKWCKIGKPIANNFKQEIADVISEEHKNIKGIYEQ